MSFFNRLFDHIKKQFDGVKPFSWQVALLLSLFSWFTYLLIRDPAVRQFVSLFGWFFLIIGTEWALIKQTVKIPGMELKIKYGPWITGAIASCALWSNNILIQDAAGAFQAWPLLSVGFAAFPRFIKPGLTFKRPDADARRDLVILMLIGLVLSCWFRFHFLLQDFLRNYPSLAADNMNRSAFVVRFNPNSVPTSGGVAILDTAEAIVRSELNKRSWSDARRWLNNFPAQAPLLNSQILSTAYQSAPSMKETNLWRFNAQFSPSIPTNLLQMQAAWLGPSSQPGGYVLQKACSISEAPVQQFVEGLAEAAGVTAPPTPYRMDCSAIESSVPGVNVTRPEPLMEQTGNFFERLFNVILGLLQGFVDLLGRMLGVGRE
ncbi:MAG TPA: DUF5357 family protein [Coleofasciculaceae cyanobacterium]